MRILSVVHYFLPKHQAGTEIYAARLARAMAGLGHEVSVFTSEDAPAGGACELVEDEWEGIKVFRLYRGEPVDYGRSYLAPEIDDIFADLLERLSPEVVHFQHTFKLSCGMIETARQKGLPAFLTLADFWHICPPILLLQPDFKLCPGPEPERCARCGNSIGALYAGAPGSSLAGNDNKLVRKAGQAIQYGAERAVQAAHRIKRKLPAGLVGKAREIKQRRELADPGSSHLKRKAMIEARMDAMKKALSAASLVIAPSEFMRQKTIEAGAIQEDRIVHSDYGFDHGPFENLDRKKSDTFRFGFIGTPVEHKGVHLAVEAMARLTGTPTELLVYGDLSWFPAYARRLRDLARGSRVRFMGRFENSAIGEILSGLDALIVPSLWYENSPLTIHEAFMAGVPVLVSDMGGMAELVASGGGLTFKTGDPEDLARRMREMATDTELYEKLRAGVPEVKTIEADAAWLIDLYRKHIEE